MNVNTAIKDIMTHQVISVLPDTPFEEIRAIFTQNDFHHLPVVDAGGYLQGIISREDWLQDLRRVASITSGTAWTQKHYETLTAAQLMTSRPVTIGPDDTIEQAAHVFLANLFHALPVVENDQLVGILTTYDLLKFSFAPNTVSAA